VINTVEEADDNIAAISVIVTELLSLQNGCLSDLNNLSKELLEGKFEKSDEVTNTIGLLNYVYNTIQTFLTIRDDFAFQKFQDIYLQRATDLNNWYISSSYI
jgi:hypothetical protein